MRGSPDTEVSPSRDLSGTTSAQLSATLPRQDVHDALHTVRDAADKLPGGQLAAGAVNVVDKGLGVFDAAVDGDTSIGPGAGKSTVEATFELVTAFMDAKSNAQGKKPDAPSDKCGAAAGGEKGAKRGPKTGPNAPHNKKIREEADKLVEEGNTITGGGGRRKETVVATPGGHKESRRPDIEYRTPEGELKGRNIGRTKANGDPIKREQEALEDLNGPGKMPTDFVGYD